MEGEHTAAPSGDGHDLAGAESEMADIEHALERLDAGTYGTCEVCGEGLTEAVLAVSPAARTCPEHAP